MIVAAEVPKTGDLADRDIENSVALIGNFDALTDNLNCVGGNRNLISGAFVDPVNVGAFLSPAQDGIFKSVYLCFNLVKVIFCTEAEQLHRHNGAHGNARLFA